ncbi:hypothetical protein [Streptomyces sp. NPDC048295]|uniref:hypothetical protein n=1 Tax=Streptomyces sp. NPDC048295 TaxID=3154617 RepID=UPI0034435C52
MNSIDGRWVGELSARTVTSWANLSAVGQGVHFPWPGFELSVADEVARAAGAEAGARSALNSANTVRPRPS